MEKQKQLDGLQFFVGKALAIVMYESMHEKSELKNSNQLQGEYFERNVLALGEIGRAVTVILNEILCLQDAAQDIVRALDEFHKDPVVNVAKAKRYYEDAVIRFRGLSEKIKYRVNIANSSEFVVGCHGDLRPYIYNGLSQIIKISGQYTPERNKYAHSESYGDINDYMSVLLALSKPETDDSLVTEFDVFSKDCRMERIKELIQTDVILIGGDIERVKTLFLDFCDSFADHLMELDSIRH